MKEEDKCFYLAKGEKEMIDPTTLVMYEKAEEIQEYYMNRDNRLGEGFLIWYYQYPGMDRNWEVEEHIGFFHGHSKYYMSTLTKVVWLPEQKYLQEFIPHKNLADLDNKFSDFKSMFYESHWFDNDGEDSLEGRGRGPFDCFKTYDELWLGFVMMDRYQKRWDGKVWIPTDIYPEYFRMSREDALLYGYPDPDRLTYVWGLRECTEE